MSLWRICSLFFSGVLCPLFFFFFFFNDTATTEIYTLSLHDALPISPDSSRTAALCRPGASCSPACGSWQRDRKSTRLNSSHGYISYAVFCLKKKKNSININALSMACRLTDVWLVVYGELHTCSLHVH